MKITAKIALSLFGLFLLLTFGCAAGGPVTLNPGRADAVAAKSEAKGRWFIWIDEVVDMRNAPRPDWFGDLDQRFAEENAPASLTPEPKVYLKDNFSRMLLDAGLEASSKAGAKVLAKVELLKFNAAKNSSGIADELSVEIDYKVTFSRPSGEVLGTSRVPGFRSLKTASGSAGDLEKMTREVVKASLEGLSESETFKSAVAEGSK